MPVHGVLLAEAGRSWGTGVLLAASFLLRGSRALCTASPELSTATGEGQLPLKTLLTATFFSFAPEGS